jgi:hypothetical protein
VFAPSFLDNAAMHVHMQVLEGKFLEIHDTYIHNITLSYTVFSFPTIIIIYKHVELTIHVHTF